MKIQPHIGEYVQYMPGPLDKFEFTEGQLLDAIIIRVVPNDQEPPQRSRCVELVVFGEEGDAHTRPLVTFVYPDSDVEHKYGYWCHRSDGPLPVAYIEMWDRAMEIAEEFYSNFKRPEFSGDH